MNVSILPSVNASLNAICTVLLLAGFVFIKQRRLEAHKKCMTAAGITSALFLTSYVIYHLQAGSVRFQGAGLLRLLYLAILFSHIILAIVIAIMVPITFWRAYRQQFDRHKAIARITFPIWLYVSVTGVIVYVMLYQLS